RRAYADSAADTPAWSRVLSSALLAGPVAGTVLGGLAWLSGGPLGAGRMAQIGPVPWQGALTATVVVGGSAVIGAALPRAFRYGRAPAPTPRRLNPRAVSNPAPSQTPRPSHSPRSWSCGWSKPVVKPR